MHVMIDLETLGVENDSVILSIGAVQFELDGSWLGQKSSLGAELGHSLHLRLNAIEQEKAGRKAYSSTCMWWLDQSNEARKALLAMPEESCGSVLAFLEQFCTGAEGVWGNGSMFDNALVASLADSLGVTRPWSYKLDRCFRTLKAMFPTEFQTPAGFVAHNALEDAKAQASYLQAIYRGLAA